MATTTTHLNFRGDARAALAFYQRVFGGEISQFSYGEAHDPRNPETDQIVWGQVLSPDGIHVMAYDVPPSMGFERGDNSFFVSVRSADADEITRYWTGLVEGGTTVVDLGPAGFSPLYGMVTDRFGVTWVLDVQADYAG